MLSVVLLCLLSFDAVSNFGKLRETLKEKKAEYLKAKRFRRLRRKLDKELKMHGSLKNMYVCQSSSV